MRVLRGVRKSKSRRTRREDFRKCAKPNNSVTRVKQFLEAEDCEAEDSSRTRTESDNSRVGVDIRTEETYMTYETYICEAEKTRVE